jgi:hypothetical protein
MVGNPYLMALRQSCPSSDRGLRVIYYYITSQAKGQIWLMTLYGKNEASDLTSKEKQVLKSAIEDELRLRQTAKLRRPTKSRR